MIAIFKDSNTHKIHAKTCSCPYVTKRELVHDQWRKAFGDVKSKTLETYIDEDNNDIVTRNTE